MPRLRKKFCKRNASGVKFQLLKLRTTLMTSTSYLALPSNEIVTAHFETSLVRAYRDPDTTRENSFCFVLSDICEILGLANPRQALTTVQERGRVKLLIDTSKGVREVNGLNMGGFFELVTKSRTEKANRFKDFVNYTLLWTIADQGHWSHSPKVLLKFRRNHNKLLDSMARELKSSYLMYEEQVENRREDYKGVDLQQAAAGLVTDAYRLAMHLQEEERNEYIELLGDLAYCVITEKPRELNPSHYPIRLIKPDVYVMNPKLQVVDELR